MKITKLATLEIAKNVVMSVPAIRAKRLRRPRTSAPAAVELLGRFAYRLPTEVLQHMPVRGKTVLEIGPGDNLGVGLTFLALGAESYTVLDRFPGSYFDDDALGWYRLIRSNFSDQFNQPWPECLNPESFAYEAWPIAIEEVGHTRSFDIVCSCAVGEHVTDVCQFAVLHRNLVSGAAVHIVDFSGHVWDIDARDPLLFRRLPDWLWSAMGSNRGYPNRVPFPDFLKILEGSGLAVSFSVGKSFPDGQVSEATFVLRPRVAPTPGGPPD